MHKILFIIFPESCEEFYQIIDFGKFSKHLIVNILTKHHSLIKKAISGGLISPGYDLYKSTI